MGSIFGEKWTALYLSQGARSRWDPPMQVAKVRLEFDLSRSLISPPLGLFWTNVALKSDSSRTRVHAGQTCSEVPHTEVPPISRAPRKMSFKIVDKMDRLVPHRAWKVAPWTSGHKKTHGHPHEPVGTISRRPAPFWFLWTGLGKKWGTHICVFTHLCWFQIKLATHKVRWQTIFKELGKNFQKTLVLENAGCPSKIGSPSCQMASVQAKLGCFRFFILPVLTKDAPILLELKTTQLC